MEISNRQNGFSFRKEGPSSGNTVGQWWGAGGALPGAAEGRAPVGQQPRLQKGLHGWQGEEGGSAQVATMLEGSRGTGQPSSLHKHCLGTAQPGSTLQPSACLFSSPRTSPAEVAKRAKENGGGGSRKQATESFLSAPNMGSAKGPIGHGLREGREEHASHTLVAEWPGIQAAFPEDEMAPWRVSPAA